MSCEIKTIQDFEHFTKTERLVIIHFWAEWNATDFTAKNIINDLEVEFHKKILFCSVDVDEKVLWKLIKIFEIKNVPAFAYFKDGNKVGIEIGLKTKEEFKITINHYFLS